MRPIRRSRALVLASLAACGFHGSVATDAPADQHGDAPPGDGSNSPIDAGKMDAPPDVPPGVTCADLSCDPNASCNDAAPACICNSGYTGSGTSCTDIDECATANGGCAAACQNTPGSKVCYTPQTCADLAAHGVTGDGARTLYAGGATGKPWSAYCSGGKEYLNLAATGANQNYSQYTAGGNAPGTSVRTTFTKLRIDPSTLDVDIADQTFATNNGGQLTHPDSPDITVTSMPFATAADCTGNFHNSGSANVDLTGTGFTINGQFAQGGNKPGGTANLSSGNQVATITGGGNCAWESVSGAPFNPFNQLALNQYFLGLTYP